MMETSQVQFSSFTSNLKILKMNAILHTNTLPAAI